MPEPDVGGLESAAPSTGAAATRFPCFDGYRAIAAISVLVTHVGFTSGLNGRSSFGAYTARMDVGIAVFFLISGFLLYRPFVAARLSDRPGPAVIPYFWRRALRILPAYWVALTVVIFVLDRGTRDLESLTLWYGLVHIYSFDHVIGPIVQSWTLGTEISFYLLLPVYAAFMSRVGGTSERRRLRAELVALAVMYVSAFVFRSVFLAADASPRVNGTVTKWLVANLDLFALGMLLAVVSAWVVRNPERRAPLGLDRPWAPGICWALAGLAFWVVSTRLDLPRQTIDYEPLGELAQQFLYGVVALLLLIPGVFGPQDRGLVRAFLRHPVLQGLGLISYGLYLWQNVWVEEYVEWVDARLFATPFGEMLLVVLVLSIITALISYLAIERPVLRLKNWGPFAARGARAAP